MVAGVPRNNMYHKTIPQYHVRSSISKSSATDTSTKRRRNKEAMHENGVTSRSPPASCLPERRYIVLPQVFASSDSSVGSMISELSDPTEKQVGVARILESFNYLCLGGEVDPIGSKSNRHRKDRRRSSAPGAQQTRVVYPIASYPGRLNSRKLIEQRRQSLPHNHFRPVPSNI